MSAVDRWKARAVRVALGRLARPPASLRLTDAELPAPVPRTVPTEAGPVTVYVHRPATVSPDDPPPVYVNLHGGGFIARHPEYDDHLCRALVAETGCVVLNVDYDVAPERPFPVAPVQAYGVCAWAAEHGTEQGWDGTRLAVGGQSAGGNLAAGVCLTARDRREFTPVLQVALYPPMDQAADPRTKRARAEKPLIKPSLARLFNNTYLPDVATRTDPLASPLLAADLSGLPPAVVITAELDLLRDEGDRWAARLAEAGVPVTHHVAAGVDHAFAHAEPVRPVREALAVTTRALQAAWGRSLPVAD